MKCAALIYRAVSETVGKGKEKREVARHKRIVCDEEAVEGGLCKLHAEMLRGAG